MFGESGWERGAREKEAISHTCRSRPQNHRLSRIAVEGININRTIGIPELVHLGKAQLRCHPNLCALM